MPRNIPVRRRRFAERTETAFEVERGPGQSVVRAGGTEVHRGADAGIPAAIPFRDHVDGGDPHVSGSGP